MSSARVSSIALESNYFTEERDDKKDHVLLCFHRKLMKFHKAKLAKENNRFHKTSIVWSKNIISTKLQPLSEKIR